MFSLDGSPMQKAPTVSVFGIKKKKEKKALFTTSAGDVNAKLPVTFLESIESEGVGRRRES